MIAESNKGLKLLLKPGALPLLARINDFLTRRGTQGYIVGGFIRDAILARDTADIDITLATDALKVAPELATALGGKYVLLDEANRVARIIIKETDQWQIDCSTIENSIGQDLQRRDFTIDAMAIRLDRFIAGATDKDILDPFGGLKDLRHRVIRSVSNQTFTADALRLLRGVRLAAELGFTVSRQTETLIRQHCQLIASIAGERVREELLKLLAVPGTGRLILYLDDLGLIEVLIPELARTKGVDQPREHQWDVFNHTVRTVDAVDFVLRRGDWEYADRGILDAVPWSAELEAHFNGRFSGGSTRRLLLKLAALLHDIAKPQTKAIDDRGRTRFLGHAREGAEIAAAILERLRFSTRETELVAGVVRHHLRPVQTGQNELPSPRAIYRYFRDTGEAAIDALFFSLADHLATRGVNLDMANWRQHAAMIDHILTQHYKQENIMAPPRLISGNDLMQAFNLTPGPKIGELLEAVREAQASADISTREEALSYVNHLLAKGNCGCSSHDRR
jgi:poly(A) polymerase